MTKEKRNRLIYERHLEGVSQTEIGRLYGLKQSAVSKIIIAAKNGSFALEKETRGAKSKLTEDEKMYLVHYLLKEDARNYGYAANIWTKKSVHTLIKQKFGVSHHPNYIYAIMKEIGFSSQKPIKKDHRKDDKKVKEFKKKK